MDIIAELVEEIMKEFAKYPLEDGMEEDSLLAAVQAVLDMDVCWEVVRQKEAEGEGFEEAVGQIIFRAEEILVEAAQQALHTHNPGDSTNDPVSR